MTISVISPVYNEARRLEKFFYSLKDSLTNIKYSYQIIFINDGSTDKSKQILTNIENFNENVKVINLCKHQGQHKTIYKGLKEIISEIYVVIDSDLEYFPEDIKKIVSKIEKGYEVVVGNRKYDNKINMCKQKFLSNFAKYIFGINLNDVTCPFRGFKKNVRDYIIARGNIESLLLGIGNFKYTEIEVKYIPLNSAHYTILKKIWCSFRFIRKSLGVLYEKSFTG